MIVDNSGIDYARMLLFLLVFLFAGKFNQILEPSGLRRDYKAVTSKLSKKVTSKKTNFKVLLQ